MIGLFVIFGYGRIVKYRKTLFFASFFVALACEPFEILSHTNCPSCYNEDQCKYLHNGKLHIYLLSKVVASIHPEFTKSVFFARSEDFGEVVIKSMTQRNLIESNSSKYRSSNNITESIIQDNTLKDDGTVQNVILCPNVQSIHKLLKSTDDTLVEMANNNHLWLDLQTSIEPILLRFLSQVPKLNVPKFYGACGDLIFTEFKGKPLTNYFNSNWKQRFYLSFQLLEMADTLTFFHPSLIIYLKDISPDNIVVNSFGAISLIDLDNVIISERMGYQNYLLLNDIHVSKVIDPRKLYVSPSEICEHPLSDHNYYAVCQYILMDNGDAYSGLLKNLPKEVFDENPDFFTLVQECSSPKLFSNRISAGKHLKKVMEDMIVTFGLNKSF